MASKSCRIKALMEERQECINCCRGGMLTTQGFTRYICRLCNQERNHPNGNTPAICQECSKEHDVCRKCGAPLSTEKKVSP